VRPLLIEPKATMPTTPRMTTMVPCGLEMGVGNGYIFLKGTHVDVVVGYRGAYEEAGEEEIEDEGG